MTTIIGIQTKDGCSLVADSRTSDEGGRPYSHPDINKITSRGEYLIAGAGDIQPCDIVQHIWSPPPVPRTGLYEFMVTHVCPSIRQAIKDNGYEPKKDQEPDFEFLIAIRGELFEIEYAIGALQAGASWETAMHIAEKNDIYTAKPFKVFNQLKT
jgi:hypothetical protein